MGKGECEPRKMGNEIPGPGGQKLGSPDLQPGASCPHPTNSRGHVLDITSGPPTPTKGAFGTGSSSRQPEAGTGPPDPSLNRSWAAVIIHCGEEHMVTQEQLSLCCPAQAPQPSLGLPRPATSPFLAFLGCRCLAHCEEGCPPIPGAPPSQPLVVTSAKGLSQRSH